MVKNQTGKEGYRESRSGIGAEFFNLVVIYPHAPS